MSEMDQIMAMIRGGQPSQIGPQASQAGQPNYGQPQGMARPSMPQRSTYGGYAGSYMPQGGNYAGGSNTFDEAGGGAGAGAFQSQAPWGTFGSAQSGMSSHQSPAGMRQMPGNVGLNVGSMLGSAGGNGSFGGMLGSSGGPQQMGPMGGGFDQAGVQNMVRGQGGGMGAPGNMGGIIQALMQMMGRQGGGMGGGKPDRPGFAPPGYVGPGQAGTEIGYTPPGDSAGWGNVPRAGIGQGMQSLASLAGQRRSF